MKKSVYTVVISLGLAIIAGAEQPKAIPEAQPAKKNANSPNKIEAINAYVRGIEKKHSSYQRKESSGEAIKKVTSEEWKKAESYWEGTTLKRMRLYPEGESMKTEEFYYENDKPVFIFLEENGANKENRDANAKGERFYFANGNLIAATDANGKAMDINSAETKKMAAKLKKEAKAFRTKTK